MINYSGSLAWRAFLWEIHRWMLHAACIRPSLNNAFQHSAHMFLYPLTPLSLHEECPTRSGYRSHAAFGLSVYSCARVSLAAGGPRPRPFSSSWSQPPPPPPPPPAVKPIFVFRSDAISVPNMQPGAGDNSTCGHTYSLAKW